jgi:hypothetical protein
MLKTLRKTQNQYMKNIELTEKESEIIKCALRYYVSNLDDEMFCLGGKDEVTEEDLIEAEKDIDNNGGDWKQYI